MSKGNIIVGILIVAANLSIAGGFTSDFAQQRTLGLQIPPSFPFNYDQDIIGVPAATSNAESGSSGADPGYVKSGPGPGYVKSGPGSSSGGSSSGVKMQPVYIPISVDPSTYGFPPVKAPSPYGQSIQGGPWRQSVQGRPWGQWQRGPWSQSAPSQFMPPAYPRYNTPAMAVPPRPMMPSVVTPAPASTTPPAVAPVPVPTMPVPVPRDWSPIFEKAKQKTIYAPENFDVDNGSDETTMKGAQTVRSDPKEPKTPRFDRDYENDDTKIDKDHDELDGTIVSEPDVIEPSDENPEASVIWEDPPIPPTMPFRPGRYVRRGQYLRRHLQNLRVRRARFRDSRMLPPRQQVENSGVMD